MLQAEGRGLERSGVTLDLRIRGSNMTEHSIEMMKDWEGQRGEVSSGRQGLMGEVRGLLTLNGAQESHSSVSVSTLHGKLFSG